MEEIKQYFQLLFRNRYILVLVPIITLVITYFLVRNLPDEYQSQAQIATGIVDETKSNISGESSQGESDINREFSNLIEMMKMKKIIDQVSYKLILHDLVSPRPFRSYSTEIKELTPAEKKNAIEVFSYKYNRKEGLNLWDKEQKELYSLLRSMKYDEESIRTNLNIFRADVSDFINVQYSSESSELSAFVPNTLSSEFVDYYTILVKENQRKSVNYLDSLLKQKNDILNERVAELRSYKINNRVLNLAEQSKQMYANIGDYENKLQETEKQIIANRGAIAEIDAKFDPKDRRYYETVLQPINQEIAQSKEELKRLTDRYIANDFDEATRASMDSLQSIIKNKIADADDKYITNPLNTKLNLLQQKLSLQVEQDIATYSLGSLRKQLAVLNGRFDRMVPFEAVIQSYERKIDIASNEYLDLLNQYNRTSMESGFSIKLRLVQMAMPGLQQPSNKMLKVILSGIISFVFCLAVFFVIFFLDNRVRVSRDLAISTQIPVLGYLNKVNTSSLDLKEIWKDMNSTPGMKEFKKQLRSTRYEVARELVQGSKRGQILAVTSINSGEGKTLISACVAYAYVMVGKKVLLIDGNFDNPTLTSNSDAKSYVEQYLKTGNMGEANFTSGIMVLGNAGGDKSLLEITDEDTIRSRFESLRSQFDVVIVEAPPLEALNKAKEWITFSDKTLSVFEADQSIDAPKKQHINYLKSLNGKFIGWVLNKVQIDAPAAERELNLERAIEV
ncbi:MAG: lipopolysaccharide biosynthesis protein [Sphingobacteriaceae bacterium]|jgi:uncharacterized protein involved in exopolysaccharide biosynthesis/Mrp family chromosome partitioning ATPase|nr:lipopolysaccharide biosynthesis protein [Sphingobacteriaceae bacterium]